MNPVPWRILRAMGPLLVALLILLGVALVVGLWLMGLYNGLVRLRQAVKNAFANIDVQLKWRHDLIPNLVNTVKGRIGTPSA